MDVNVENIAFKFTLATKLSRLFTLIRELISQRFVSLIWTLHDLLPGITDFEILNPKLSASFSNFWVKLCPLFGLTFATGMGC